MTTHLSNDILYIADYGTRIEITVTEKYAPIDISTATTKKIILSKPSHTIVERNVEFITNGKDGKLYYIIESGLLDEVGTWQVQVSVATPDGQWHSSIKSFIVHANLKS